MRTTTSVQSHVLLALSLLCGAMAAQAQAPAAAKPFTMPAQAPETPAESASKAIVLNWFNLTFVEGNATEAFAKYVSHDFVEHSRRVRGNYDSTLKALAAMKARALKPTAFVDDEIVFVQSEIGNEVFRVQHGKITDHWDVNP